MIARIKSFMNLVIEVLMTEDYGQIDSDLNDHCD